MLQVMVQLRSTAAQRRADAVAAGMRTFAVRGYTTLAIQEVAGEIGVSQPYIFRLFGSKQEFFLACLDGLKARVSQGFRAAAEQSSGDALAEMGLAFRELNTDGVIGGLWLHACTLARESDEVALRCREVLAELLDEARRITDSGSEDLARFLADGMLVVMLQSLKVDLTDGTREAINSLSPVVGSGAREPMISTRRMIE